AGHAGVRSEAFHRRRRRPQRAGRAAGGVVATAQGGARMSRRPPRPSHEDVLWLNDYLPYRLAVIATRMLREASQVYKRRPDPLTTPQWRVLAILANFEPLTATEIGRISMLDKVAISRALAQLQRRGFVARQSIRDDRRALHVTLTAGGWRYYNDLVPEM